MSDSHNASFNVDLKEDSQKETHMKNCSASPSQESRVENVLAGLESLRVDMSQLIFEVKSPTIFGNFGVVRLARLGERQAPVAVKELRPAGSEEEREILAKRLARELRIWASLDHPNILPVVGFSLSDDMSTALLLSPWASNGHVGEFIKLHSPQYNKRMELAIDAAAGLKYLHDNGICHADLKMRNLLVKEDGHAVLCDFGLTKALQENELSTGLTTTTGARVQGTPRYFSPELLLEDNARHNYASDVWAWGCLILEIVTGTIPYAKVLNEPALYYRIANGEIPAKITELLVPPFLRNLLRRCWLFNPQGRPLIDECVNRIAIVRDARENDIPTGLALQAASRDGESITSTTPQYPSTSYTALRWLIRSANLYRSRRDYQLARDTYYQARDLFREIGSPCGMAYILLSVGNMEASHGEYAAARELVKRAREEYHAVGDAAGMTYALESLGNVDYLDQRPREAETAFKAARAEFQRLGILAGSAACLMRLAILFTSISNNDASRAAWTQARLEYTQCQDGIAAARTLEKLGELSYAQGQLDEGRSLFSSAQAEYLENEERPGAARCLQSISNIDRLEGRLEDAINTLKIAQELYEALKWRSAAAQCLHHIGDVYFVQGRYAEARQALDTARAVFLEINNPFHAARCLGSLALVYGMEKLGDKSRETFLEAREQLTALKSKASATRCIQSLGDMERLRGDYDAARHYLQQARGEFQRLPDPYCAALCLQSMGKVERAQGQETCAEETLFRAGTELQSPGTNPYVAALSATFLANQDSWSP